jgi:hypothetical protein
MMARRLFAVGSLVAVALACATPTLPLPPPELPTVEKVDANHVKLVGGCGSVEVGAYVEVENRDLPANVPGNQAGTVSRADGCGQWDATVYAHSGDVLQITQWVGTMSSTPEPVPVP